MARFILRSISTVILHLKVMENLEWFLDEGGRCNILTVLTDTNVETGEILELAKFEVKNDMP